MGVDFGGEEIRFADLNAHLHHQWEGGEISTFAIVGGSSNVFSFTDEDGEGVTEQKELFDIDFDSQLQVYGMNLSSQLGSGRIKAGLAFSKTNTGRLQQLRDQDPLLNQELINNKINGNLSYALALGKGELTAGAEILLQDADLETFISTAPSSGLSFTTSVSLFASSPFLGYGFTSKRSSLNLGLRASSYGRDFDELSFEPRFSYELRTNAGRFLVNAERISTPPVAALLVEANFDPLSPDDNNFIPVSNNFELGYGNSFGGITAMLKGYFQFTNKDYGLEEDGFIRSANNLLELYAFNGGLTFPSVATRRYGIELDLAGGRKTKGWYYRGNFSLLRAETEQADGSWTKDRFSVDYIAKVTVGREWNGQDRKERDRTYGFNLALIANGGERYGVVDAPPAGSRFPRQYFHRQNLSGGYVNQIQGYFRPDLRLYKTKTRPKTTTTLALDIQNVAGVENLGNVYYDVFLERPNERFQLGLIPVLSYRVVWR